MEITAVQQLIKKAIEMSKQSGDSGFVGRSFLKLIENENSLEVEKQQIIGAWCDGNDSEPKEVTGEFAELFYEKTYGKAN